MYIKDAPRVAAALKIEYGDFAHNNKSNPLDELLFILCSVQTTSSSYEDSFRRFKAKFPSASSIALATEKEIAKPLHSGGLSQQRARAIKEIIETLVREFGKPTLAPLKQMGTEEAESFLMSLPRVGKKVSRCVLMYSLGRDVFPADTHCWRICRRLGWVRATSKSGVCREKDMDRLQEKIPPRLRFSLHVNFVSHGREICTYKNPKCGQCNISRYCRSYKRKHRYPLHTAKG